MCSCLLSLVQEPLSSGPLEKGLEALVTGRRAGRVIRVPGDRGWAASGWAGPFLKSYRLAWDEPHRGRGEGGSLWCKSGLSFRRAGSTAGIL